MARRRSAVVAPSQADHVAESAAIVAYYRRALEAARPPTGLAYPPVHVGPTWDYVPGSGWRLPERTLGWGVAAWIGRYLRLDGAPYVLTPEQLRWLLWWFAVDEHGRWVYTTGFLRRCKGWGKDPLVGALTLATAMGPSVFAGLDDDGNAVGREPEGYAHVQVAATTMEHTRTTMALMPSLISADLADEYAVTPLKRSVWGRGGLAHVQAVTSNPAALEGFRPMLTVRNEVQNWTESNRGLAMARVMNGNAAKGAGGLARILDVCNAHRTGEDSLAEQISDGYAEQLAGRRVGHGLMFDSLEAPSDAPLTPSAIPDVVRGVRGDATWLDPERIMSDVLSPDNPPSESRRKWYNTATTAEDAWIARPEWDAAARPDDVVEAAEPVYLFLDGSKSQDSTALIGCRQRDGHVFAVHVWQRPPRDTGEWVVPRDDVDRVVREAHTTWRVLGLWVDPSDARDSDTGERYWEPYADRWAAEYGDGYELLAVRSGDQAHAVLWDMRWPSHQRVFVDAAERFVTDVGDGLLTHDGSALLTRHVLNARRRPNRYGVSLGKEHRSSRRHVDAAVAAVGARMMRRLAEVYRTDRQTHDERWWA